MKLSINGMHDFDAVFRWLHENGRLRKEEFVAKGKGSRKGRVIADHPLPEIKEVPRLPHEHGGKRIGVQGWPS